MGPHNFSPCTNHKHVPGICKLIEIALQHPIQAMVWHLLSRSLTDKDVAFNMSWPHDSILTKQPKKIAAGASGNRIKFPLKPGGPAVPTAAEGPRLQKNKHGTFPTSNLNRPSRQESKKKTMVKWVKWLVLLGVLFGTQRSRYRHGMAILSTQKYCKT